MITPEQLRKCAMCVYLAAEAGPADDISSHLKQAADRIEELDAELAALRSLVREIGKRMDFILTMTIKHDDAGLWLVQYPTNLLDDLAEILSRPEVVKIMQEKP